ncbi:3-methyladenine DNA glycosylase [Nocardioides gansuensis]|uniref:3-methyladenine DNA glycosylase n=1 Tax=Nocardioides gansuensis TaxID=2138300 RepID=A0A2T8FB17_9ACTN|nr:DNA-3-methyladenine glycosylase 2 family protein [Nocardioides gansuensis]PVG82900.1 3-methyladenine DNA glycosylase [Nocardioides gansuensis]
MDGLVRQWRPSWPCPAASILLRHRRGGGDPTYRIDATGRHWRGIRTPEGPATLLVEVRPALGDVRGEAWGPGAEWVLAGLPELLGAADDVSGFEPRHPVLVEAWRRHGHWRLGRSGLVMEALVPAIVEQKVTGQEAFAGFRSLVRRFGEPAPGPGRELGVWVQPAPETLRTIASWEWLALHIDPARSRAIVSAARVAAAVERSADQPADVVDRRLRSLPGVGVWTSAEVRQRSHGDADAVSFGDYHVAKDIGWALTGAPVDDAALEELLEPWRPHRGRVQALVVLAGLRRPRRGPRLAPRTHLPARLRGADAAGPGPPR